MPPSDSKALLVGISGVSSSGKTTLARLLRDIFPRAFILHEDDFYKTDAEIPKTEQGVADWDCLESINLPYFSDTLRYIRENGLSPPDFASKEDQNSIGQVDVDRTLVHDLEWKASKWMFADAPPIAIIDGFLLYSEGMKDIRDMFDLKLFLRTDFETAKHRRKVRSGYVTLEGFWEDPPGYVENVVWPNYVKDHAYLFQDGNVEGAYDEDALRRLAIKAAPDAAQANMTATLQWAYDVLDEALDRFTEPRLPEA
ncbi:Nicotinamide riboside kinase [Lecanosticta acicola]|uniref:Nicotinamide riboside kinase n=1 Tax=Lecanosticta acicola TaxID=111012 RepID=A0AAI8Z930_9PEZI|nr:Nicotinamide riboside kinase [Lecanosticta acicola]